jgi:hypothetical protein
MPTTTPNSPDRAGRSSPRGPARSGRPGRPADEPEFRRLALAPGLLGAMALLIGFAFIEGETFVVIRYVAAILALIMMVFVVQGRAWWWLPPLAAIAVLWNPIYVIAIPQPWWTGAQYLGVLVFVLAGVFTKVRPQAG